MSTNLESHLMVGKLLCLLFIFTLCANYSTSFAATDALEYRIISTTKIDTFRQELASLANQGFRVVVVAQSLRSSSLTVIVSHNSLNTKPEYNYKLLPINEFKKQKEELQKMGFSCRGALWATSVLGQSEPLILFEKNLTTPQSVEIELIEANKEKELQEKMNVSAALGFEPVTVVPVHIFMQRNAKLPPPTERFDYRLIEVYKMSTLEKEISNAAHDGYRVVLSGGLNSVIMRRKIDSYLKNQFEYRLISLEDNTKSLQLLMATSSEGFSFFDVTQMGLTAIFERQRGGNIASEQIEFKMLETVSTDTMGKEFTAATTQGFKPHGVGHGRKSWMSILLLRGNFNKN